ncbi:SAM-dependent methyltransferase [Pelagivirga sediminicola]|uniref:SAM-dependent methyltransferase n=1 Tax=Pelagivirga sediminicola TaxID=2170575 RepID=A0A2T7GA19_9RHOB|nr:cyclopropane-fatty-acyl-phospholipid synthase family protein [Pelagivirga sediminicola]PVA11261.1 SAM-dependent methyltransferase [Pelagivirga sediminicola]
MWSAALHRFLETLIKTGQLTLTYPDGTTRKYQGSAAGPHIAVTLKNPALPRRIMLSPEMGVGEGYVEGDLTIENDDLEGFLRLAISNIASQGHAWYHQPLAVLRYLGRRAAQFNPAGRSRANVAHHYDLSGALYDLFLDADRQYSCAYFKREGMTLGEAQEAKKAHIAGKLLLRPGMRVLDIGCGWGGMGLTLARDHGANVLGVTLSEEQHKIANQRARDAGLQDVAKFELIDYRDVQGKFDRIVSVGMFEHVGTPQYRTYFNKINELLTDDGVALVHTIGRAKPPGVTSPWILKYIFPGGYVPSMSEMTAAVEQSGLITTDLEVWRLHYAETLRHWYDRFMDRIDEARQLYDDQFCRMWRFYLKACELTFRLDRQVVFQVQLARQQEAVPLTRDYLYRGNR